MIGLCPLGQLAPRKERYMKEKLTDEEKYYVNILAINYVLSTLVDAVQKKPSRKFTRELARNYGKKVLLHAICHYFDSDIVETRNTLMKEAVEGYRKLDITVGYCWILESEDCINEVADALHLEGMIVEHVHDIGDWIERR